MTRVTALLCRPAWYHRFFGFVLLLGCLIALSCQKKPTEPKPNDPNRTDTQLKVPTYTLAKGETQEFPAGFEIVAAEGIDIAGDLIITPSRPGDFILRAENGNIRISGKVIVQETGNFSSAGKKIIRGLNALKKETAQQGTSLFFTVNRQAGATIDFARWAAIKSGNGMDALGTTIESWDGFFEGEKGGRGGDISITAGRIILPKVQPGDPPLFTLGNGGNGSNITVDRNAFNTKGTTVDVIGGHGAVSGHLYFETDRIEGIPSVDELSPEIEYLAGGVGGRGGNVIWENTEQPILPGSSGTLDFLGDDNKLPSLQEIILRGGWGGSGAIEGGKGGFAAYWSGRVIHFNVPNKKAASVSVTGGNGGEVFGSPVPIYLALGGEGGEYIVLGNYGQPGAAIDVDDLSFPNGADGGNVVGIGGKGGSILEDVIFHSAIGGDGGNSEVAQTRLPNELQVLRRQDPSIFTTAWYGVTAGAGGWGADRDNGCPGGNGGNSGTILAEGGNGGNVPNRPNARGGRGGDVWSRIVITRDPFETPNIWMNGGNGNPPGKKGCRNSSATSVGTGGQGYVPGESGQYLGIQTPLDYCGTDGELSGEGLTCKDDTTNCWEKIGSSFTGYSFENSRKTSKNDPSIEEIRSGSITMEGKLLSFDQTLNKYIWEVKVTSWEFLSSKGKVIIDTTWQRVEIKETSKCDNVFYCNPVPNIGPPGAPRCLGGRLYFPNGRFTHAYHVEHENDPIIIDVNIVLEYSGCHAYGDIGDWVCCNNGGDGIVRNIRRDGDCP